MGTRADFYVGRGLDAEWLGSIAWDGWTEQIPRAIREATNEHLYRKGVAAFLAEREDGTLPEQGWPWPWEDSRVTDYAYAFDGEVWGSNYGDDWFKASEPEPGEHGHLDPPVFPNMKDVQNVTFGERSGVMLIGIPEPKEES